MLKRLFRFKSMAASQGPSSAGRPHSADIDPSARLYPTASIQLQGLPGDRIRVGANSHIRGELLVFGHGGRVSIGEYCYVGEQSRIWSASSIDIGNRVLISHCVTIMDSLTHPMDAEARHDHFRTIVTTGHPTSIDLGEDPVIVEDDVLVGCQSVVLRGVHIGRGAIIGAGSVVTSDIPAMVIAAGNPARVIRPVNEERAG